MGAIVRTIGNDASLRLCVTSRGHPRVQTLLIIIMAQTHAAITSNMSKKRLRLLPLDKLSVNEFSRLYGDGSLGAS